MSDFRRFVSYVYEYQNNKKMGNKGFIKVEARNGICQLSFALKGLCHDGNCNCRLYGFARQDSLLMGSSLGDYQAQGGILNCTVQTTQDSMGSENFTLAQLAGILIMDEQQTIYATQWDDDPLDFTGFPNTGRNLPEEAVPEEEAPEEKITEETIPGKEITEEKGTEQVVPAEKVSDEAITEDTAEEDDLQATSAEDTPWNPFPDGDIINCIKITPKDISRLNREDWHLNNNRFVSYGYQNFGHLVIGQLATTGQTILGVPGTYHQQECFMANMFGFPNFKRCRKTPSRPHCFGYWYRSIQPTNLSQRDCSS